MDPASLLFGIVTGCVGLAAVQYGRSRADARPIVLGVLLMALPFVLDGVAGWIVGALLAALLFWP